MGRPTRVVDTSGPDKYANIVAGDFIDQRKLDLASDLAKCQSQEETRTGMPQIGWYVR
jgi:hypothetical protein